MTETEAIYIEDEPPYSGLFEELCGTLPNKYNKRRKF